MEKFLFYAYLKYIEDNKLTFWPQLFKLPKHILCLFLASIFFIIFAFISSLFSWSIVSAICVLLALVLSIVLYTCIERYQIKCSINKMDDYINYCKELYEWLNSMGVVDKEFIEELHKRISDNVVRLREERQKNSKRIDTWMQTLIIPILIVIITTIISGNNNLTNAVGVVIGILMMFGLLYGVFITIRDIVSFPQKRRIEQLSCFESDLQGILDYTEYGCVKKSMVEDDETSSIDG